MRNSRGYNSLSGTDIVGRSARASGVPPLSAHFNRQPPVNGNFVLPDPKLKSPMSLRGTPATYRDIMNSHLSEPLTSVALIGSTTRG